MPLSIYTRSTNSSHWRRLTFLLKVTLPGRWWITSNGTQDIMSVSGSTGWTSVIRKENVFQRNRQSCMQRLSPTMAFHQTSQLLVNQTTQLLGNRRLPRIQTTQLLGNQNTVCWYRLSSRLYFTSHPLFTFERSTCESQVVRLWTVFTPWYIAILKKII